LIVVPMQPLAAIPNKSFVITMGSCWSYRLTDVEEIISLC